MIRTFHRLRSLLLISAALMLTICVVQAQAQKRKKYNRKVAPPVQEYTPEFDEGDSGVEQIRLKLADGTFLTVDDAWESEQGIWYKQGGMTHLASRDRVKAIRRSLVPSSKAPPQIAVVKEANPVPTSSGATSEDRPAWIYLKGGARVEADSASESTAGVWYKRGAMSVFIDRSRIDRIEREDPENLAKAAGKERGWSSGSQKLDALIRQNGAKYGVDPYLIFCVMEQESHFNSRALSPKGARGLMQLMPGTAARFGVRRPHDPGQNIGGGTRYLKQLLNRFGGRVDLVLASYNAGEGAVIRYGHRVPPYRETRNYVKRISYRYRRAKPAVSAPTRVSAGGM
jgi:soluble lytic murein transglycosylase-like protein